jgi:hypothetical protein
MSEHEAEKRAPESLRGRGSMTGISSLAKNLKAAMDEARKAPAK